MEPKEPAPAPLDTVQRFINTAEFLEDREDLATPHDLEQWLSAEGLPVPGDLDDLDVRRARRTREDLRAVLASHTGLTLDASAVSHLNELLRNAQVQPRFDTEGGLRYAVDGSGLEAALGALLRYVLDAQAKGIWTRLKACASTPCLWVFYDRSRNHSSRWCEMKTCGSRHKMKNFRARSADALH